MVGLTALRAFEDGVFHEVGEAVLVGLFVAGAGLHHHHQVCDFAAFLFMYQPDTVWKTGFVVSIVHIVEKIGCKDTTNRKHS